MSSQWAENDGGSAGGESEGMMREGEGEGEGEVRASDQPRYGRVWWLD